MVGALGYARGTQAVGDGPNPLDGLAQVLQNFVEDGFFVVGHGESYGAAGPGPLRWEALTGSWRCRGRPPAVADIARLAKIARRPGMCRR